MRHLVVALWLAKAVEVTAPHFAFSMWVALDHLGHDDFLFFFRGGGLAFCCCLVHFSLIAFFLLQVQP